MAAMLICLAVGLTLVADKDMDLMKTAHAELQGMWKGVKGEANGRALHEDLMRKMSLSFKGDTCIWQEPGGDRLESSFKINPKKKPKEIDFTFPADSPQKVKFGKAIYKVEKEHLTLCFDMDLPETRPTKFESKKGSGVILIVYKKEK